MIREEAIEILKDLWRTKHSMYLEADIRKALEMAVQALEQEPKYCDRNICLKNEYNGIGCDECEVGNPCLYCEYEFKAKADRNEFYNWDSPIRKQAEEEKNCDNCGKLKYHCQECGVNLDNWTPKQTDKIKAQADGEKNCLNCKHQDFICEVKGCKDYKKWEQADGEYIPSDAVIDQLHQSINLLEAEDRIRELPSVAIPPEHDGCKDCRWHLIS